MNIKIIDHNDIDLKRLMSIYQSNENINEKGLLKALKRGHLSILEFIDITFLIQDISIVSQRQIMRHRHFSYAERSLRVLQDINYKNIDIEIDSYNDDSIENYSKLLIDGENPEVARYVLPLATETQFIMKGNLRSWIEFIQKRYCIHAQKETQLIAKEIHRLLSLKYPKIIEIFNNICYNKIKKNCKKCIREQ